MSTIKYRRDIDGLRAMAIMPVVLNHAGVPGFPGGFVGVDIFFVISGFLISGILVREIEENRYSLVRFYERRARRILPALFVVILAALVGGWFLFSPALYEGLGKSVAMTLLFVSNLWFWHSAGDYFGPGVELEPLLHTWSLAVEEQFYVLYPLLLWALSGHSRKVWILAVGSLTFLSLALSVYATSGHPTFSFYLLPTRIWELGAGALLALGTFPVSRLRWAHEVTGVLGLVLILSSIVLINDQTPFPGIAAVLPVSGTVLLIFAGSGSGSTASRLLSLPLFVGVGLISYSLYLWHWPIIVAARMVTGTSDLSLTTAAICIVLAMALAVISLWVIERPFRQSRGDNPIPARGVLVFSLVGTVLLGAGGAFIAKNDGFVGQVPPERFAVYERAIKRSAQDLACMNLPVSQLPCRIGETKNNARPARVAIWGDSHVGAMLSGFDDWFKTQGESALAYTKSACLPLLGVRRVDRNNACDAHNATVLAMIEADSNIHVVVLAGRWALSVEGARAPNEAGQPAILAKTGQSGAGIEDNARLVSEGLAQLVARLRARGIIVVIIAGIPEIGRNVPDLILVFGSNNAPTGFIPDLAAYTRRNGRANAILERISTEFGAQLVEPANILCAPNCRVEVGGELLYRDDDHLSDFGARWLLPQLMAASSEHTHR